MILDRAVSSLFYLSLVEEDFLLFIVPSCRALFAVGSALLLYSFIHSFIHSIFIFILFPLLFLGAVVLVMLTMCTRLRALLNDRMVAEISLKLCQCLRIAELFNVELYSRVGMYAFGIAWGYMHVSRLFVPFLV